MNKEDIEKCKIVTAIFKKDKWEVIVKLDTKGFIIKLDAPSDTEDKDLLDLIYKELELIDNKEEVVSNNIKIKRESLSDSNPKLKEEK